MEKATPVLNRPYYTRWRLGFGEFVRFGCRYPHECGVRIFAADPRIGSNAVVDLARLLAGTELRRHWRRQLALAILVAFTGGVVLTCAAAARRTDSSLRRYIDRQAIPAFETSIDTEPVAVPGVVA